MHHSGTTNPMSKLPVVLHGESEQRLQLYLPPGRVQAGLSAKLPGLDGKVHESQVRTSDESFLRRKDASTGIRVFIGS